MAAVEGLRPRSKPGVRRWVSLTVLDAAGYPEVFGNLMIFPLWPKPTPAFIAAGVAWLRADGGQALDPMSSGKGGRP